MRLLVLLMLVFTSCSSTETNKASLEYSIAREALKAAKTHGADSTATDVYLKSNNMYELGERHYRSGKFSKAVRAFNKSIKLSEEAENISRLDNSNKDDVLP